MIPSFSVANFFAAKGGTAHGAARLGWLDCETTLEQTTMLALSVLLVNALSSQQSLVLGARA